MAETSKLNAVAVVEMFNGLFEKLETWPESFEGNRLAEEAFIARIKKDQSEREVDEPLDETDIQNAVDDGHYNNSRGLELFLTHSQ